MAVTMKSQMTCGLAEVYRRCTETSVNFCQSKQNPQKICVLEVDVVCFVFLFGHSFERTSKETTINIIHDNQTSKPGPSERAKNSINENDNCYYLQML
jgi:hypothetical protein